MSASSDQELEDLELTLPDIDPDSPLPEIPYVENGPLSVCNYGGIPITRVTGEIKGMSGGKLSQLVLEAVAMLGMNDSSDSIEE